MTDLLGETSLHQADQPDFQDLAAQDSLPQSRDGTNPAVKDSNTSRPPSSREGLQQRNLLHQPQQQQQQSSGQSGLENPTNEGSRLHPVHQQDRQYDPAQHQNSAPQQQASPELDADPLDLHGRHGAEASSQHQQQQQRAGPHPAADPLGFRGNDLEQQGAAGPNDGNLQHQAEARVGSSRFESGQDADELQRPHHSAAGMNSEEIRRSRPHELPQGLQENVKNHENEANQDAANGSELHAAEVQQQQQAAAATVAEGLSQQMTHPPTSSKGRMPHSTAGRVRLPNTAPLESLLSR